MSCPYLEAEPVDRCLAYIDGIRILRDRELKGFCHTAHYASCQIYQRRIAGNREQLGSESPTPGRKKL